MPDVKVEILVKPLNSRTEVGIAFSIKYCEFKSLAGITQPEGLF